MDIQKVDLLNGGDYTGKTPVSLSFYGTEFRYDKWADLCTKFFEKAQEIHPAKLDNLARFDRKHGGLPYLCTKDERNKNRPNNRLNRSNIFLYVGYSTNDHIKHIRELIQHCDLDVSKISIRYVGVGTENIPAPTRKVRSSRPSSFKQNPNDGFELRLLEPSGVVPQNIKDVFIRDYPDGFDFKRTTINLLEVKLGCDFTEEEQNRLKRKMYRRSDGLYFLYDSIVERQVRLQICEFVNVALEKFYCFELNALYERFSGYFNSVCIRNLEDFENWFSDNFSGDIKAANYCGGRIVRPKSTKLEDVSAWLIQRISDELKKADGTLEEEKLLTIFDAFSSEFLGKLIQQETDDVIGRQINGRTCYQAFGALELPEEFPEELSNVLEKIDDLELEPDLEIINALLSVAFNYNFRNSFNIPNDKTYCQILQTFYQGVPRVWKAKSFKKIDDQR